MVSSKRCCVFAWERSRSAGVVYVEAQHCPACVEELRSYTAERGWALSWARCR